MRLMIPANPAMRYNFPDSPTISLKGDRELHRLNHID
jgi:hypothetical protein